MSKCPECGNKVGVTINTPCKKCSGDKTVPDGKGGTVACDRCNGSGKEIRNVARRNRARGNATELQFAKEMQKWWRAHDPDAEFQRTPSSGGSKLKDGWGLRGDVVTNSESFPFFIECKKEKAWNMHDLLSDSGGRLGDYFAQIYREDFGNSVGLLRFSHPGPSQPTFVAMLVYGSNPDVTRRVGEVVASRGLNAISFQRLMSVDDQEVPLTGFVVRLDALLKTNPADWIGLNGE